MPICGKTNPLSLSAVPLSSYYLLLMLPLIHLYFVLAITLGAYGFVRWERGRGRRVLRGVAGELELTYAAVDPRIQVG